jgi:transposase
MAYPLARETHRACVQALWARTPPEVRAYLGVLEARVASLEAMVQALQEQNCTLQEQLNHISRHSFRPLSSDPPRPQRPSRHRGKRRRGGQPGHPGATRTLLPVEEVDEVVGGKPEACTQCHGPLWGDDPAPWRQQGIEMPPIRPVVTAYQWHQLVCPACGTVTRAPGPAGVPRGTYGPRRQARVALCTGA